MKRHAAGFVYVLANQAMPGLVKVGFTSKFPEGRASQLRTTGVPLPFSVEYRCLAMQPDRVERRAHEILSDCRVANGREFFRAEVGQVIMAVEEANRDLNGVATHSETALTRIRRGDRIAVPADPGEIILLLRHRALFRMLTSSPEILDILRVHDQRSQLELYGIGEAEQTPGLGDSELGLPEDPAPYLDRDHRVVNGTVVAIERLIPGDQLLWIPAGGEAPSRAFEVHDWCQLVGRTWNPTSLQNGYPLLWNHIEEDQFPTRMMLRAREGIAGLPAPRSWAADRFQQVTP